jgi:hypothetical protein
MEGDGDLTVLEARLCLPGGDKVGYGRDWEEARSHAGFDDPPDPREQFREFLIRDGDGGDSRLVAEMVCRFHVDEDEGIPPPVRDELSRLLRQGLFASAVAYCFGMVWDRGFEGEDPAV